MRPTRVFKGVAIVAVVSAVVLGDTACGADAAIAPTLVLGQPQALVSCETPPDDLQARLWISGNEAPCFLDVDDGDGAVSGDCSTNAGIERAFTLDWFIDRAGRDIVLVQARQLKDLSAPDSDTVTISFADDDYISADCKDMSNDSFAGEDTVDVDGVARPVCDLDADDVDNVVEVCAGDDPTGRL